MASQPDQPPQFHLYEGLVESPFLSTDQEILADLLAVIKATALKPVCLTKAGIPPKPLWTAINRLLVWKDPNGILYDWEEADQVRFTYRLAEGLDLVRPDEGDWLHTGPGADQFFLAGSYERAILIRRAYFNLYDWDERCDARDIQGHRYNFGQAFRRDFIHDVLFLREFTWSFMKSIPQGAWVRTCELAAVITQACPDLLLSEVCELPEVDKEGFDPEILRFVNYWLSLLSRFGWADLARSGGDDATTGRLFRLTSLGWALAQERPLVDPVHESFTIDDRMVVELAPEASCVSDQYVAWRISQAEEFPAGDGTRGFRLSRAGLQKAVQQGVDLASALDWVRRHARSSLPAKLVSWVDELMEPRSAVALVQNAVVLDLYGVDAVDRAVLVQAGFQPVGDYILVAGTEVPRLFAAMGGEPEEGFDYPPEEPYARWKSGPVLDLVYTELPLFHRALLVELGLVGEPPSITFTRENLTAMLTQGWTLEELLDALQPLTLKPVPSRVKKQLEELVRDIVIPST